MNKEKINKKIKSLELQIKSISDEIHEKWKIREDMTHKLFEANQEKHGKKHDALRKKDEVEE